MSMPKQGWFRFAKSEDKFIWQMFSMEDCLWSSWAEQKSSKHGILHVILRGPERWQATWFRKSTFFEDVSLDVRTKVPVFRLAEDEYTKSLCFLAMTWPWWKKMPQLGRSFWSWRSRFHQVVFPLTKLATNCSWQAHQSVLLCLPGRIKGFWRWNTLLLTTFQVWKKFWKLSPPKVPIFRVCLRTSWTNNTVRREVNFRRGRCAFFPCLSFGWTKLKLLPKHLVVRDRRCVFVGGTGS